LRLGDVVKALKALETRNESTHLAPKACGVSTRAALAPEWGLIDQRGDYFGREGPEVAQEVGRLPC